MLALMMIFIELNRERQAVKANKPRENPSSTITLEDSSEILSSILHVNISIQNGETIYFRWMNVITIV